MISKKNRRKIIVDRVEYHYKVRGYLNDDYSSAISVLINNTITNEKIKWQNRHCEPIITPKHIRTLIETRELNGIKAY